MEKITYFDYCAFVIFVILIISTFFRRMTKGKVNYCFLVVLITSLISVIADISAINLDNMGPGAVIWKYFSHTAYLFFHNMLTPLYIMFLVLQADTWHKLKHNKMQMVMLFAPIVIVTAVIAINPIWHIVFYLDENDVYTRGAAFPILYFSAAFYTLYGIYYVIRYRQLFGKGRFISLITLFPLIVTAVIIQLFLPNYIVEMFANACGCLFVSMMVQRPEETIDIVTGLGKLRAYVNDMRRSFTNEKPIEIILVNIVNYSSVRDMLGYDAVNEVLHRIATKMVTVNRNQGIEAEMYYLDNGKFRFVIEEEYFDKVEETAQLINSLMKDDFQYNQMELNLVTCVCVAKCPQDIADVDSLLAFGQDLNTKVYTGEVLYASNLYRKEYYDIMRDIDRIIEMALAEHKFSVYYQPIYSVKEQRFHSAEALLRLKDDKYGFISPEIFIPAAEKSGAIHRIGTLVLEEVCKFIASDEYKALQLDYIEVNLSVAQCMENNLAAQVLEMLEKYQIAPEQINLEITETAASYSQKTMMENLSILDHAGVRFSLDDFGTGYSNMRRIASLPLHIVKLDKSLANMEMNPRMQIFLQNTIQMIKAMNMQIVVEGIETENRVKQFSDLQCEYIQGYYYSKPIPRNQFVAFIKESIQG